LKIFAFKCRPEQKFFLSPKWPQKINLFCQRGYLFSTFVVILAVLLLFVFPAGLAAASKAVPTAAKIAGVVPLEWAKKKIGIAEATLTYDQAVETALKNSMELKNAREGILQTEEMREQLANLRRAAGSVPVGPGYDLFDAADRDLLLKFTAADTAWRMAAKQAEALEGTIAFQVRSAYDDVLQNAAGLEKAERALDFTAKKLIQTDTKTRLGMESDFNRENTRQGYAADKEQQEQLARQLDEAYTNLNKLLGVEAGARPKLQEHDPPVWLGEEQGSPAGLGEAGLERHLSLVMHDHPYIWLQEQQVAQAERELSLYTYNAGLPPYKVVASTVQQEKNNLYALKEEVRKGVRSLYYQLQGLESQYKALEKNLAQAENGRRVTQLRLKLGMAVPLEVEQAELAVLEIKCGMQDLARAGSQLKMLYEKPWLISVFPKQ
jgi:hypothetical protein